MKVLLMIGLLAAVLTACGPSTSEVEEMIATAVAESEERITEEFQAQTVKAVSDALVGSEERMTETLEASVSDIAQSICASDYMTMSNYTTLWLITDHLQGGETAPEDLWAAFDDGLLPLDEVYVGLSHVCDLDGEAERWVLVEQPKVAIEQNANISK